MRCSVLVAVYNAVSVVRATLQGLRMQSEDDFEVVICDDGSTRESTEAIEGLCTEMGLRHQYVYHYTEGFQKTIALNKGVACSRSDYVVFLDGDCIPHRHFVRYHCALRERGRFLAGRRVMLGESLTRQVGDMPSLAGRLGVLRTLGRASWVEEGLILPAALRRLIGARELWGCNWSCWKSDLERINGFNNESLGAVGAEDTNIDIRLNMLGLRRKSARFGANVFHQFHARRPTVNAALVRAVHPGRRCDLVCANGLRQVDTGSRDDPAHGTL
jgi:glycosyltransferase involved in cell wall biosynthesis